MTFLSSVAKYKNSALNQNVFLKTRIVKYSQKQRGRKLYSMPFVRKRSKLYRLSIKMLNPVRGKNKIGSKKRMIFYITHPRRPEWLRRAGLSPLRGRGITGIHFFFGL